MLLRRARRGFAEDSFFFIATVLRVTFARGLRILVEMSESVLSSMISLGNSISSFEESVPFTRCDRIIW